MSNNCGFESELEHLKKIIAELEAKAAKSELIEQKLRDTNHQLDRQFEKFSRIHVYALNALQKSSQSDLDILISEGIVDIFQLEGGAVFNVNLLDMKLELKALCNLDSPSSLCVTKDWLDKYGLLNPNITKGYIEVPAEGSPWQELDLAHAVFMPLLDNDRALSAIVLGAITKQSVNFYEFRSSELLSSFMVFCQLMNGILNNAIAMTRAQQSAIAKNRFLANLSHEIRTPMNAVIGMVQLASRNEDITAIRQYIRKIDQSSRHLLGLLNEVLDLAKIDEGRLTLNSEAFFLRDHIDSLLAQFTPSAEIKKQNLHLDWQVDNDAKLIGDPIRLGQVVLNLLSNAVKFTPEGGDICLLVKEVNRSADSMLLRIAISDTGKGISKEAQQRIFKAFEQEDGSISRSYGGTGLGLAVSQKIVELMGGLITLKSRENVGTTFTFSIRFDLAEFSEDNAAAKECEDVPDLSGYRVLVVDDVDINREIASALLEETHIAVEEAEDGQVAVNKFLSSPAGYYDCILMDVQMPVLDGCAATKIIRASGKEDAGTVAILALTANVFADDVREVLKVGMDGYIPKPVEFSALVGNICRLLPPKGWQTRRRM